MTLVALATAVEVLPPDTETEVVAGALRRLGVDAVVEPWDGPFEWASADLVVIRSTWDYVARLDEFLAWVDRTAGATRLTNPAAVVRWNAHKRYLLELGDAGVPIVPTTLVERGSTIGTVDQLVASATGRATAVSSTGIAVVKPAVSAGAHGAARGAVDDPALAVHLRSLVATADALVQPLVPSVPIDGEVSLIYLDGEPSHAVRKRARTGDYRVQSEHGGTVHLHTPTAAEVAVAEATLAALPRPCAYARVDLVAGDDGPLLMEVELIEPQLFLDHSPNAADRFAALLAHTATTRPPNVVAQDFRR